MPVGLTVPVIFVPIHCDFCTPLLYTVSDLNTRNFY